MRYKISTYTLLSIKIVAVVAICIAAFGYIFDVRSPVEPTAVSTGDSEANSAIEPTKQSEIESTASSTTSTTHGTTEPATYSVIESVTNNMSILSPFNYLLGIHLTNDDDLESYELAAQESVKECMFGKGFEYIPISPYPPSEGSETKSVDEGTLAYVERHGYGITDSLEREINSLVNVEAFINDPNEEIRAGLSKADSDAYDVALTGYSAKEIQWRESDGAPTNPTTGRMISQSEFAELSKEGCLEKAYAPKNRPKVSLVTELLASDDYKNIQSEILNDNRMIDLQVGWSRCMAAEGYDYGSPNQLRESLYAQGRSIMQKQLHSNTTPSNMDATALLAGHRAIELELASVDWVCSSNIFERAPIIAREHEVNFIEENKELILDILHAQKI